MPLALAPGLIPPLLLPLRLPPHIRQAEPQQGPQGIPRVVARPVQALVPHAEAVEELVQRAAVLPPVVLPGAERQLHAAGVHGVQPVPVQDPREAVPVADEAVADQDDGAADGRAHAAAAGAQRVDVVEDGGPTVSCVPHSPNLPPKL